MRTKSKASNLEVLADKSSRTRMLSERVLHDFGEMEDR